MSLDDDPDTVRDLTTSRDSLRRHIQQMDPSDFAAFVADVWDHTGWTTRTVSKPGDVGIDVIATNGTAKQLIQAKRYGPDTLVGSPEVYQYATLRIQHEDVERVTIVTMGEFTRQAEHLVSELNVILIDGEELLQMLTELEHIEVFAEHFEDIPVETTDAVDNTAENDNVGLVNRIRSWFG